jgi:hypothetical protein
VKTDSYNVDDSDQMRDTALSNYSYGDQVIFVPFYLRDSYLNYLWRNEKDKNYDILATALLKNTFTRDTVRQIFVRSRQPKILFVEDVRMYDPTQGIFPNDILQKFLLHLEKAKALCSEKPEEKLRNSLYVVSTCAVEPE